MYRSSLNNVDEREEDEIECIEENCDDRSENLAEDVENGVLEKPISVGIHGKTGRKRQILNSEDDSEDQTQQTDLLKKTSRKRQLLDSEDESEDGTLWSH